MFRLLSAIAIAMLLIGGEANSQSDIWGELKRKQDEWEQFIQRAAKTMRETFPQAAKCEFDTSGRFPSCEYESTGWRLWAKAGDGGINMSGEMAYPAYSGEHPPKIDEANPIVGAFLTFFAKMTGIHSSAMSQCLTSPVVRDRLREKGAEIRASGLRLECYHEFGPPRVDWQNSWGKPVSKPQWLLSVRVSQDRSF
jgi:hypothetical protein